MATTILRKGRSERTGRTILRASENMYMGANYRQSGGGSAGTGSAGAGAPSGTATDGSTYVDTNTGAVYYYYSGAWH